MDGTDVNPGINVRVMQTLFKLKQQRVLEVDCEFQVSMSEFYNENVFDLLALKSETDRKKALRFSKGVVEVSNIITLILHLLHCMC